MPRNYHVTVYNLFGCVFVIAMETGNYLHLLHAPVARISLTNQGIGFYMQRLLPFLFLQQTSCHDT